MSKVIMQIQQHSLANIRESRGPVKEVSNLLQKKHCTVDDLLGLSWVLFEEDK